jgi:hypothetical protein
LFAISKLASSMFRLLNFMFAANFPSNFDYYRLITSNLSLLSSLPLEICYSG